MGADRHPPMVNGAVNPETIVQNENRPGAWLARLPLFQSKVLSTGTENVSSGYYAPEQMRGEVDPSSDLYGLAPTMHHAVTAYDPRARLPFFHPPPRPLNPPVPLQMDIILPPQLSLPT